MSIQEKLQSVILSNRVSAKKRRIGIEVECLFYDKHFNRIPVNKGSKYSASDLLVDILKETDESSYSLEPGGQLEWASQPTKGLHDINKSLQKHKSRELSLCHENDLYVLDLSLEPLYSPEEIDLIDQNKYRIMDNRFRQAGQLGPWMMRNTTSIQINLDLASKKDAEEMAYISDVLQPFSSLLFANSPFMNGNSTKTKNVRYNIWSDTDPVRCGSLLEHGMDDSKYLLDKFSNYVMNVPAIFVYEPNGNASGFEGTLGQYLETCKNPGREEILSALHQIFTHIRFKHVLEIRGADRPPSGYELAPAAFWLGLLTGNKTREKVRDFANGFTLNDRNMLNRRAKKLDLNQKGPHDKHIGYWLEQVCILALDGLVERKEWMGVKDELTFLDPYLNAFFNDGFMSLQCQKAYEKSGLTLNEFLRKRCEETLNWN